MPRIPYLPADINEPRDIVDSIRARRSGQLLNLDRMLLHSPAFASGWNALLGEVRGKLSLPARQHELAICAVAVLTDAEYEYHHHAPEYLRAGGTEEELSELQLLKEDCEELTLFAQSDRAILMLAREMTLSIRISDATFAAARAALDSDQQINELIGVIACYNMVSRYLVALQIEPEE
ncbi:MAG TPA: carboxymuconolactone decarboxylase family protein [Malonomonas sp.]